MRSADDKEARHLEVGGTLSAKLFDERGNLIGTATVGRGSNWDLICTDGRQRVFRREDEASYRQVSVRKVQLMPQVIR